ncbi:unnamed protein product [Prunus armeniaca]
MPLNFARLLMKPELDQMVAGHKEAKTAADKLERQIKELQKQLAGLRRGRTNLGLDWAPRQRPLFLCRTWLQLLGQHWTLHRPFFIKGCFFSNKFLPRKSDCKKPFGN